MDVGRGTAHLPVEGAADAKDGQADRQPGLDMDLPPRHGIPPPVRMF
jgi:hypothetical protein